MRGGEFIDPEYWATGSIEGRYEGLLLVEDRGRTNLVYLVGLFDGNGSEEVVEVRTYQG